MLVTVLIILGAVGITFALVWPLIAHFLSSGLTGRWWW